MLCVAMIAAAGIGSCSGSGSGGSSRRRRRSRSSSSSSDGPHLGFTFLCFPSISWPAKESLTAAERAEFLEKEREAATVSSHL